MMKSTKILLVGDDTYEMYVKAFYQSFQELGFWNVRLFATNHYMQANYKISKMIVRIENKIAYGPRISVLNNRLIEYIEEVKPELIFLYSSRLIYATTIKTIKNNNITVFAYNNDDPFASYFPKYFWRHFKACLKYVDAGIVYREKNIEEYKNSGCKRIEILRAYYIKSRNYHMYEVNVKVPAVVFLGHNENDERQEYIRKLLKAKIEVGVPKSSWENFEVNNPYLIKLENSHEKYNEMLNGAQIAVVFLSKINNDTYTRRCFEIPATKTLMVAPYTDDIAAMFKEDEEVILFRNGEEFVEKIQYYLNCSDKRQKVAEAGYQRLLRDGHEVADRLRFIMKIYDELKGENRKYD